MEPLVVPDNDPVKGIMLRNKLPQALHITIKRPSDYGPAQSIVLMPKGDKDGKDCLVIQQAEMTADVEALAQRGMVLVELK